MNFEELKAFISDEMRMSHIYQPFLIRALVDANGTATLRSLAQPLLLHFEETGMEARGAITPWVVCPFFSYQDNTGGWVDEASSR